MNNEHMKKKKEKKKKMVRNKRSFLIRMNFQKSRYPDLARLIKAEHRTSKKQRRHTHKSKEMEK